MKTKPKEAPETKSLSRGCFVLKNAKRCLYQNLLSFFTLICKSISTFAPSPTTASAAVNSDVEPLQNLPPLTHPPSPSSLSLPDEIVVTCLALISRSYYPKLSLVSKSFHSLIFSNELNFARYHSKTQENFLYICLQLPSCRLPSWFSLWIKPDQILTNDMDKDNNNKSTGSTLLVAIPSSHSPRLPPLSMKTDGSKYSYLVKQYNIPPTYSPLWVCTEGTHTPSKAPSMKVARDYPVAGIVDGKIYVMGGCKADESTSWAEVFDPKTQTWESLPDPGAELRLSLIKNLYWSEKKVYVSSSQKHDYFYDPKEDRWGVGAVTTLRVERMCLIENVWYACRQESCSWYDTERKEWRVVKGLEVLNKNCCAGAIAIANYCGKLLILWDKFEQPDQCQNKNIWCSVVALERHNGDDDVYGNVEWASVVLTVPSSYVFLHCHVLQL